MIAEVPLESDTKSLAGAVPGVSPQVYSDKDFRRIAALVRSEAGIVLSDGKRMLAYSRIAPLLRKSRHSTFSAFLDALEKDSEMKVQTIGALTTNHTYFNREAHHFEHFENHVRPSLIEHAEKGSPVRIWSAACSSGEEIWTLMMALLGQDKAMGRKISGMDIIALATDLSGEILLQAKDAQYSKEAISALPDAIRTNWVAPSGDMFLIHETLRKMVRFRQLNLLRAWPFSTHFDVIFCRNVMIYFDQKTKNELVYRLAQQLKPGGTLYVGHSERVLGPALDLLETCGPTIYQRRAT